MKFSLIIVTVYLGILAIPTGAAISDAMSKGAPDRAKWPSCYAMAMVGKDSVINARLGLLPEHTLKLASLPPSPDDDKVSGEIHFDGMLLNVMLSAYLWHGTPQAYANQVFDECARKIKH